MGASLGVARQVKGKQTGMHLLGKLQTHHGPLAAGFTVTMVLRQMDFKLLSTL